MDKETAKQRHQALTEQGWEWRFTGERSRSTVVRESYESLGMETRIEDGILGNDEGCKSCFEAEDFELGYVTVYTRGEAKKTGRRDDDLFE